MESALRDRYKSNGIILGTTYEQYQKDVYFPTQDIFVRFDDQYEQFTDFFVEQGRRRRVSSGDSKKTPSEIVKGMKLYHSTLRDRLEAIHHFRTQHEKLHSVVVE
eukprot:1562458-Ditylum_brightwellii.AAC.1